MVILILKLKGVTALLPSTTPIRKRPFYSIRWLGCHLIWIQLYLLHTFDTVLSDFLFLSLNLESQIDMMKKIIPYSCNIPSLLLHFDTVLSNWVFRVSMKSQINDKQNNSLLLQHYISTPYFWYCAVWFPFSKFKSRVSNRHHGENNSLLLHYSISTPSFSYCDVKFEF